jgi:flagellar hook assembly protein FlgD
VSVVIYDFLGREVRVLVNNIEQPGSHSVNWNGKDGSGNDVSAGIYLYRIQAGGYVETRKMVLLK